MTHTDKSPRQWFYIDTGYACGGVSVYAGRVIHAAPIFRWMEGQCWNRVRQWHKILEIQEILHLPPRSL